MKKYRWNKKEIKSKIKELKTKDLYENPNLQNDLDVLKDMLKITRGIKPCVDLTKFKMMLYNNQTIIDILKDDFDTYITDYQNDVIVNSIEDVCYSNYEDIYKVSLDIPLSLEMQQELIYKYFSDGKLYRSHKDIFNTNQKILHLTKLKDVNETESLTHKDYICVCNKETANDFKTLCHELGHYDERLITDNRLLNARFDNNLFKYENFIEIYSIFYELISIDILEKEKLITPHDGVMLHLHSFLNKTIDGKFYNFAKYCTDNNEIPSEDNFYIRKEFMYPSSVSIYYYPFLISCILYMEYKKDPERAFHNINYIVKNITPDNEKKILTMADANPEDLEKINNYTKRLKTKS